MGNWQIFDTFEELESFVKDTGIDNALLSIFTFETLDTNSLIEEKFKFLYRTQNKKVCEKIKKIEKFVKSKAKDYKELEKELYEIISIIKSLKGELFNLYMFDSVYSAAAVLNEHQSHIQVDKYNYTYKDMAKAFEIDEA